MPADRAGTQYEAEMTPGKNSGLLPGLMAARYEDRSRFQESILAALHNPKTGENDLARVAGAPSVRLIDTHPSAYFNSQGKLEINPATTFEIPRDVDMDTVRRYALLHGILLRQEAVAGYTAIPSETPNVGYRFTMGRPLSVEEVVDLARINASLGEHGTKIGVFNRPDGFRLVNFSFGDIPQEKYDHHVGESVEPWAKLKHSACCLKQK